jgi:hypothetical protein
MTKISPIDITFDFRSDTPAGKDPDTYSPTLRKYHKYLWNKPLPNGDIFKLDDSKDGIYLFHHSKLGEFHLSSDTATHTFSRWASMSDIISQIDKDEIEIFRYLAYTIGSMIIFPSNRVDGKNTINGARGFHPLIKDRIDLTLECIRRFYINEASPLADTLERYRCFFELFDNFEGYIEFFLLQDLVVKDFSGIKFFIPFDNFKSSAVPKTLETYLSYKSSVINYITARNQRILATGNPA